MRHFRLILMLFAFTSAILISDVSAQSGKTQKKDTTAKQKKTSIVGQDSVSKKNAERQQNRKRQHKKHIDFDKKK